VREVAAGGAAAPTNSDKKGLAAPRFDGGLDANGDDAVSGVLAPDVSAARHSGHFLQSAPTSMPHAGHRRASTASQRGHSVQWTFIDSPQVAQDEDEVMYFVGKKELRVKNR
jgi:hypothetical protein